MHFPRIPIMSQSEANYLLRENYSPIDWITPRQVAIFWGVERSTIGQAKHRKAYDQVPCIKIGQKTYWSKYEALIAWAPSHISEEEKFELIATLPKLLQAEIDQGIYSGKIPDNPKSPPTDGIRLDMPGKRVKGVVAFSEGLEMFDPANPIKGYPAKPLEVKVYPGLQGKRTPEKKAEYKENRRVEAYKVAERFPVRKKFEMSYLEAMADIVTLADWEQIVVRAVNDAVGGDSKARTWISDYLIGKPITRIASIAQVSNSQMGEDERAEYLAAIFQTQISGDDILDVKSFSENRDSAIINRNDEPDPETAGRRDTGAEHALASTSEE